MDDWVLDRYAYESWGADLGDSNKAELDRVKRMLPALLEEFCTPKQRACIAHYYGDRMKMREIAALYGVSKSTVSRTIKRGLLSVYRQLRFCSPLFMDAPQTHRYLRNGRGKQRQNG